MGLDDIVSDAVDAAVAAESPALPADPSDAPTAPAPDAAASSSVAPAAPSGSEAASPTARSTDPATIPPSATVAPAEAPGAGEPPREKWPQVLENARRKARDEAYSSVGLTPGHHDPHDVRQHVALLTQDPVAYYHALGQALQQSGALRTAPQAAPAPATPEPLFPEADLQTADGTPVYSRDGMLAAASQIVKQALAQFREEHDARMTPLVETASKIQAAEIRAHSHEVARDIFAEIQTWPHFETLRERITDLVKAQPLSRDIRAQVDAAYNQALREYLPTYESTLRASTRQDALGHVTTTARGARRASTPAPTATVGLAAAKSTSGDSLDARISRAVDQVAAALPR